LLKKIIEKIKKEYTKKTKSLVNFIFRSSHSLSGLEFDSLTNSDLKNAKFIHWPSLAKLNEIIYKKFVEEKNTKLILVIDEALLLNRYYFAFFSELRKEIIKNFPNLNKKILLIRKGKLIDIKNNIIISKIMKEDGFKEIKLNKLRIKNSIILILSDFLDNNWNIKTVNKIIKDSSLNSEFFFICLSPKYDFYFGLDYLFINKLRDKFFKRIEEIKGKKLVY